MYKIKIIVHEVYFDNESVNIQLISLFNWVLQPMSISELNDYGHFLNKLRSAKVIELAISLLERASFESFISTTVSTSICFYDLFLMNCHDNLTSNYTRLYIDFRCKHSKTLTCSCHVIFLISFFNKIIFICANLSAYIAEVRLQFGVIWS